MEQIVKTGGKYFYGKRRCLGADDAYCHFRDEYNASVGRVAFKRLSRLGSRKERVHGYGFVFDRQPDNPGIEEGLVWTRLLGNVCGSYCRMLGGWDIPGGVDEVVFERWFDCVFSAGSGLMKTKRK